MHRFLKHDKQGPNQGIYKPGQKIIKTWGVNTTSDTTFTTTTATTITTLATTAAAVTVTPLLLLLLDIP